MPSQDEMRESLLDDHRKHQSSGKAPRHFHKMGPDQWTYNREIAHLAQEPEIPCGVEKLYKAVHESRHYHLMDYKKEAYAIAQDGQDFIHVQQHGR